MEFYNVLNKMRINAQNRATGTRNWYSVRVCLVAYSWWTVFLSFLFVPSFTVSVLAIWQPTCTVLQPTASFLWLRVTRASPVFSRVSAIQRSFFSRYFISWRQDGEHGEYRCVFERPRSFFPFSSFSFFMFSLCRGTYFIRQFLIWNRNYEIALKI